MTMSLERKEILEFGDFRLDIEERSLERSDGLPCRGKLPEKTFRTLVFLVKRRGHLVTKRELFAAIWPDTIVEDNNIDKQIHNLRRFLDENSPGQKYIETVPKHGYRFIQEVRVVEVNSSWLTNQQAHQHAVPVFPTAEAPFEGRAFRFQSPPSPECLKA